MPNNDLVRMLITDCWKRMNREEKIPIQDEIARLERVKEEWLDLPDNEHGGKSPSILIENERRRLPWISSEEDSPFDEDCPCCPALANEKFGPDFWHLDGCNMDSDFAFSFFRTRGEWEEENRRMEEIVQSIEQRNEGEDELKSIH